MAELLYDIQDMHCGKCAEKIRTALEHLNGVDDVQVNIEKKSVLITGEADPSQAELVLQEAGYSPLLTED